MTMSLFVIMLFFHYIAGGKWQGICVVVEATRRVLLSSQEVHPELSEDDRAVAVAGAEGKRSRHGRKLSWSAVGWPQPT